MNKTRQLLEKYNVDEKTVKKNELGAAGKELGIGDIIKSGEGGAVVSQSPTSPSNVQASIEITDIKISLDVNKDGGDSKTFISYNFTRPDGSVVPNKLVPISTFTRDCWNLY